MAARPVQIGETAVPTAREAARAIAEGRLTATALVEHCLARIDAVEDRVRAWVHVDRRGALAQAAALDAHRQSGRPTGPLHGVPVGIKDNIDVAGLPCERGVASEAGRTAGRDAEIVRRLRNAGAIILGKTVTTELAGYPPSVTRNPHDPARTPGGSSAGSAAAVAAGMVPLAVGSQTNGSVIRPASFCGIFGFKPSFGTIPRTGVMPNAPSLDHLGLMSRALEDLSLVELLAGADGADPDAHAAASPLAAVAASAAPARPAFAFVPGPAWDAEAEPATRDGFEQLAAALDAIVDPVPLAAVFDETLGHIRAIMAAEGARDLGHYLDRDPEGLGAPNRALIEEGRRISAADYLRARAAQAAMRAGLGEIFARYDAIITPATAGEAPPADSTGSPAFCSLWTLTGLPAVTLPLLTGPNGLPVGVQLVGAWRDDARLLRTARWIAGSLSDSLPDDVPGTPGTPSTPGTRTDTDRREET
ncbi:amidase [Paralimibaculum aggregatum]|uniref:Amidase n=1 Tax=Paralimibaculum aggregatum TaxID=3036245 RepID=A0ABQ6LQ18_9RHOB|nr:amidase [Limibaculum sp. NKW23]GMG82671.1 amidase [Limibaculum sp. NKW23]